MKREAAKDKRFSRLLCEISIYCTCLIVLMGGGGMERRMWVHLIVVKVRHWEFNNVMSEL